MASLSGAWLLGCTSGAASNHDGDPAQGAAPGSSGAGSVSGGASGNAGTGGASGASTTGQCLPGASFAPARLTLLSDDQYRNVIHDSFGVTLPTSVTVTALPSTSGNYPYNENAQIQTTTVQAYQRAADAVAALLTSIPGCASTVDATCMEQYLRKTLPLAWRRPVTDTELSGLIGIFTSGAPDGPARQVQLTMEAALLHPAFLYRSEIGTNAATAAGKVALTAHELASAVSFAMLDSAPDAELRSKAEDGSLTAPTVLSAQVTRLMALPQVQANLLKKVLRPHRRAPGRAGRDAGHRRRLTARQHAGRLLERGQ